MKKRGKHKRGGSRRKYDKMPETLAQVEQQIIENQAICHRYKKWHTQGGLTLEDHTAWKHFTDTAQELEKHRARLLDKGAQ